MGRASKREEIEHFIEMAGLDPELIQVLGDAAPTPGRKHTPEPDRDDDEVPSVEEIRDELLKLLYKRRGELKGIALVQGLKALESLVAAAPEPEVEGEGVSILDRIDALPKDHAAEILRREITRLDNERAEFFAALERVMEAE